MTKLHDCWDAGKFLCVGLDTDLENEKFPADVPMHSFAAAFTTKLDNDKLRQLSFNCWVVDSTKHIVCAYKPNLAFYEGDMGKLVLRLTIIYIRRVASWVVVLLDAKQGDIDNTNNPYVREDFEYYDADAVTVHNYLGMEAMRPFLDQADRGVIVLCRTSNEGSGEFQNVRCLILRDEDTGYHYSELAEATREGVDVMATRFTEVRMRLFEFVARRVKEKWNYNGNCAVVLGATYPTDAAAVREILRCDVPVLVPGVGAQGAKVREPVEATQDERGEGMIVNASRAVIFPGEKGEPFSAAKIRAAADAHHTEINKYRHTA